MRLKNYITEINPKIPLVLYGFKKDDVEKTRQKLYEDLQKDCDPYKRQAGKSPLYRGHQGPNSRGLLSYEVKVPRENRNPKDTPLHVQRAVDDVFQDDWGWRPRQTGVFVSGDRSIAGNYGQPYIVVPIGQFKYLWSTKVSDLFSKLVIDDEMDIKMEWEIKKYFERNYADTYRYSGLPVAAESGHEIMLGVKSYYLIGDGLDDVVSAWLNNKPYEPLDLE